MSRVRITQLREERHTAYERMKTINDLQDAENRDLTGEETGEYTGLEERIEQIDPELRRLERAEGLEQRFEGAGTPSRADIDTVEERALPADWGEFMERRSAHRTIATPEYRDAWFHLLAAAGDELRISPEHRALLETGEREQRALSAITGAAGGFTVPVETYNRIIGRLRFFSQIRQVATVLSTATGVDLKIPIDSDIGVGGWAAENTAYLESDVALGTITLKAWKYTRVIKVPKELLQDSIVDIEAYIVDAFARSFALGEGAAYVIGDGISKPSGIVSQAQLGVTVASAAALTADNLIDLMYSVAPPYRQNASWLASDTAVRAFRKFKDSQGRYMWEMNLQAGAPDVFLGKRIVEDPFLDALGATSKPVLFGDMSYFWIRDVAGIMMQRLVELFAVQGQVGFLSDHRSDSKLTQPEAVKYLTATAA